MTSAPQMTTGPTLEEALSLLRAGDTSAGVAALEDLLTREPGNSDAAGHLAWEYLHNGNAARALPLYEDLLRRDPDRGELRALRALASIVVNDLRDSAACRRECVGVDFRGVPRSVAARLVERIVMTGDSDLILSMAEAALRAFPGDHDFGRIAGTNRLHARRRRLRRIAEATGAMRLLRYLLRFGSIRGLVVDEMGSANAAVQRAIEEFYTRGSVMAVFPEGRDEESPDNFHRHFAACDCAFFKWFREHGDLDRPGARLVDVGCGPGFIGHHFQSLGMEVTGVSGSSQELDECQRRGFRTCHAEMHAIPLKSGDYDFVLASHVLEHSVAPMLLLYELKRLLKPGGRLLVNLPHPIDAEPRRDFPEAWDEKTQSYTFEADLKAHGKNPCLSYYSFGFPPHIFVLTYWQWRWVFQQSGLRMLASGIEVPGKGVEAPTEELLKSLRDKPHHCNMLFVLEVERA